MVGVTLARKLVGIVLLIVLFGYPARACLSSVAEMTEAERTCCKEMAQQCGSMGMPASHSCCRIEMRQPNLMLAFAGANLVPVAVSTATVNDLILPDISQNTFSAFQVHPPPESPPGSPSILRI